MGGDETSGLIALCEIVKIAKREFVAK